MHVDTLKILKSQSKDKTCSPSTFLKCLYPNDVSTKFQPIRIINNHILFCQLWEKSLRNYTIIIDVANMKKMGLLIVGTCCIESGRKLWSHKESHLPIYNVLSNPNIGKDLWVEPSPIPPGPFCILLRQWWQEWKRSLLVNYVRNWQLLFTPSLIVDESMSDWLPEITPYWGLLNIMYVCCA